MYKWLTNEQASFNKMFIETLKSTYPAWNSYPVPDGITTRLRHNSANYAYVALKYKPFSSNTLAVSP